MQELVGQTFRLAQGEYTIVDVLKLDGDYMVYAETECAEGAKGPNRAAFRLSNLPALHEVRA